MCVSGIFSDLTKGFDSANHETLQMKLNHYGVHCTISPGHI